MHSFIECQAYYIVRPDVIVKDAFHQPMSPERLNDVSLQ